MDNKMVLRMRGIVNLDLSLSLSRGRGRDPGNKIVSITRYRFTADLSYGCMHGENSELVFLPTLLSSASDGNPNPNTVFALASDHWPNFWEVFVNVMFGKMVLLTIACQNNNNTNELVKLIFCDIKSWFTNFYLGSQSKILILRYTRTRIFQNPEAQRHECFFWQRSAFILWWNIPRYVSNFYNG